MNSITFDIVVGNVVDNFWATVGQMMEEMIEQYLEHHFERRPNDNFKTEPS